LSNTVYALDSTTIDLCLSVFPWAHFRCAFRSWRTLDAVMPDGVGAKRRKLGDERVLIGPGRRRQPDP
jgi:hypothetical protein